MRIKCLIEKLEPERFFGTEIAEDIDEKVMTHFK